MIKKLIATTAALGLVASPVMAQAATSLRDASSVRKSDELTGIGTLPIIIAVIAVGIGIIIIASDDNNNEPTSP